MSLQSKMTTHEKKVITAVNRGQRVSFVFSSPMLFIFLFRLNRAREILRNQYDIFLPEHKK